MKNLLKYFTTSNENQDDLNKAVEVPLQPVTHDHNWEVIAKTYAPPTADVKGITNILFQCTNCKSFHKEEMIGSDETQLEDLIIKTETFGQQLFKYNNNFYVISKYIPQTQQQIPVR